jgi:sugar lactone lactonase YvrE
VSDVAIVRGGAYFTDSVRPFLYRAGEGEVEAIPLSGDIVYGAGNNANGIEATPDGKTLIIVQSNVGKLFTVDPETGQTRRADDDRRIRQPALRRERALQDAADAAGDRVLGDAVPKGERALATRGG